MSSSDEKKVTDGMDLRHLMRIVTYVRPHKFYFTASMVALLVTTTVNLLRPIVMGRLAQHAAERDATRLLEDGVVLAALLVVVQGLTFAQTYTMQVAGARAMADLRLQLFKFMQGLSMRFMDRTPLGRLVTRATNDVDALGEMFASGVLNAVGDLIALVAIVCMMVWLDWRMSLVAFAALPLIVLVVQWIRGRSRVAYRSIRTLTARINVFLSEQVSGIAVVQAFGREASMRKEFDVINRDYRDANIRVVFYESLLDATIEWVNTICIAGILWWAGLERMMRTLGDQHVTFALVVTFTQYIRQFFEPIGLLSQRYTLLQSAMSGAERVFELLDETDVELLPLQAQTVPDTERSSTAFELSHVFFGYKEGIDVLRDVSLRARPGEKIALVGATGAGKSTVSSLLLRLYEVREGEVTVFGQDVRTYDLSALRRLCAVVPQDMFLFPGTVASNIAVTDRVPDKAKVLEALERMGVSDLFGAREGGIDAPVDERGANFSGGERQLIAFARALYQDAPIVILDEATANVDSDTEARVQRALSTVMHGRTSLVIAHRLSTIQAADRIVVFHKGKVVEEGAHADLLARGGVYAKLHSLQFS